MLGDMEQFNRSKSNLFFEYWITIEVQHSEYASKAKLIIINDCYTLQEKKR